MENVLLDTNVFSYLIKTGDTRGQLYVPHIQGKLVAISFITVGELYEWTVKPGYEWSAARIANLEARIRSVIVIPSDDEVCRAYAPLAYLKMPNGGGRTIDANDRWIAACALHHDLTLLTHNRDHFEGIPGLRVISEAPLLPSRPLGGRAIALPKSDDGQATPLFDDESSR
jgi:tRNA(fMet)-specific endonuclease VapC